jgi:hypothetical protein
VWCKGDEENARGSRVAERFGYFYEGTLRSDGCDPDGTRRNMRVYAMTGQLAVCVSDGYLSTGKAFGASAESKRGPEIDVVFREASALQSNRLHVRTLLDSDKIGMLVGLRLFCLKYYATRNMICR